MHSAQTIRLQVEYVLLLFSVVHCTDQNLLTLLGKEGELDLFIRYEFVSCGPDPLLENKLIFISTKNFNAANHRTIYLEDYTYTADQIGLL